MTLLFLALGLLIAIGVPVGFAILGASLFYLLVEPTIPLIAFLQRIVSATQSFPLVAIPLFVFTGGLMNISGISKRMMDLAHALTAHMVGGLAQVNVVLSTLLAGMSGSANADAAMQAKILVPEMVKRGYSPAFSAVVTAASSLIAPMIPPGIGLIMFGFVANVSVGRLFMGGIIPGLIMTVGLMLVVRLTAGARGYGRDAERLDSKTLRKTVPSAIPALLLPVFLVIGLRAGIFTPSEGGGFAALYALVLGLWYREITWSGLLGCLKETAATTAAILVILAGSSALSYLLALEQVPQMWTETLIQVTQQPHLMLVLIFGMLLIAGMFIEGTAGIIILAPLLMPVIRQLNIDPVHFGIVMVYTMHMAGITPPVGTIMFTTCSITRVSVMDFVRESLPFYLVLLVIGMLLIFVPGLTTWLAYL